MMAQPEWMSPTQTADLADTGFPTVSALARSRGMPVATIIHRLKHGRSLAEAADPDLKIPSTAKTKRVAEKLTEEQRQHIRDLGFDSVRSLAVALAVGEAGFRARLQRGWSVQQAISAPLRATKPLPVEKLDELATFGCSSVAGLARLASQTVNQVWDRWIRLDWPLDRVLEEAVRTCVAETTIARSAREADEQATGRRMCIRCSETRPMAVYRKSPASSNGRFRVCTPCVSFEVIQRRYGLTRDGYHQLWRRQTGRCFGCSQDLGEPGSAVHVEHDHSDGHVRGLACAACNWTLGDFKDDPVRLRRAASWLEAHMKLPDEPLGAVSKSPGGDPRAYTLWRDHSMSVVELAAIVTEQQGRCGICAMPPVGGRKWVVDHDHAKRDAALAAVGGTGRDETDTRARSTPVVQALRRSVRGVLCEPCNKGLGHALENPSRLLGLANFLEGTPE